MTLGIDYSGRRRQAVGLHSWRCDRLSGFTSPRNSKTTESIAAFIMVAATPSLCEPHHCCFGTFRNMDGSFFSSSSLEDLCGCDVKKIFVFICSFGVPVVV